MRLLWVVEMKEDGKWVPTVGVHFTRKEGFDKLKRWRWENPADEFRVRAYVPREEKP